MSEDGAAQPSALWDGFLEAVRPNLSSHVLETWLRPVHCIAFADGTATLEVRDQFFRDWLTTHYIDFIRSGLSQHAGRSIAIAWSINPHQAAPPGHSEPVQAEAAPAGLRAPQPMPGAATPKPAAAGAAAPDGGAAAPSPARIGATRPGRPARRHAPRTATASATEDGASATDTVAPPADDSLVSESLDPADGRRRLNHRYSFDTFVCGPSNQFAFAACKAVAENPGQSYNPLFLFGGVGLGKTHLLSAIGHQILRGRAEAQVIYTSSEQFTNEVINAVLGNKLEEFRGKYRRSCDVILMDDIQLIAGKDRTQHEFFHIFNTLYDSQRQIVVTSDKLPHEIPEIEERLRTRFQWGLIADIQPPEIETRIAILRKKAFNERLNLSDEVAFFLAKNIRSNVRELEGALVRIMAHASLTSTAISVDYARNVLSDILSNRGTQLSVEAIQKIVAGFFQVRVADLKSHRRLKALVRPRQVAMYLARKHTDASYPELGSRFGDKDHTTIMNAFKRVEELVRLDPALRGQVLELERQLDVVNK